jgi:hypothetical protein
MPADVSGEHVTSIFSCACYVLHDSFLIRSFFDHEVEGDTISEMTVDFKWITQYYITEDRTLPGRNQFVRGFIVVVS